MSHIRFLPIPNDYMHGFAASTVHGICVEVVRCYQGSWDVFLTRAGSVVAVECPQKPGQRAFSVALRDARQVAAWLNGLEYCGVTAQSAASLHKATT